MAAGDLGDAGATRPSGSVVPWAAVGPDRHGNLQRCAEGDNH